MMPPVLRTLWLSTAVITAALALGACGTEGIQVSEDDPANAGATLFAERCSGCHTLDAAGTEGSANRSLRNQGPNLNQRVESTEDVLYAIRNGGFSGAIMPQNIVTGEEADQVADFVAEYAGGDVDRPPKPGEGDSSSSSAP
jgi:mono/diheme cytochrome c family protein